MATSAASQSLGSITFNSGFFAQITDLNWSGIKREAIETSHQGLALAGAGKFGNKTFIASKLNDPGEMKVSGNFNPDTLVPIEATAETITVSIGDSSTKANWTGTGFMTDFEWSGPIEDRMTFSATIKFSGNITKNAGS